MKHAAYYIRDDGSLERVRTISDCRYFRSVCKLNHLLVNVTAKGIEPSELVELIDYHTTGINASCYKTVLCLPCPTLCRRG